MAIRRGSKQESSKQKTIKPVIETTTSGADMLDLAMGGGAGWGKVLNLVGDKSTGKTLLAIELLVAAIHKYKDKLIWFWDDAERGFSFNSKDVWGIDILPEDKNDYSETVEEWMYNVRKKLEEHIGKKKKFIYVVDSLDALSSDDELQRAAERDEAIEAGKKQKGSYKMEKAKLLSEFFRILAGDISGSNCLLIVISQVRSNIGGGPFGKKTTRSGGKGLDFYACHVIDLKEIERIEDTYKGIKRKTGVTIHAFVSKNKLAKPYRECVFKILFDYGIDNVDSNICFLFDLITDKMKTKKKIEVKWDGEKFDNRKELIQYIEDNNQESRIKKMCEEKWDIIENALSPKHRKSKW